MGLVAAVGSMGTGAQISQFPQGATRDCRGAVDASRRNPCYGGMIPNESVLGHAVAEACQRAEQCQVPPAKPPQSSGYGPTARLAGQRC